MTTPIDRRALLGLVAAAVVARRTTAQQPVSPGAADPLPRPGVVGAPRRVVDSAQNDPVVVGIEKRLRCPCPCGLDVFVCRTTDFTCTYSPARHDEILGMLQGGMSAEEVVAAFVEQYGEEALMAPKAEGFGVVGYLLPGAAIVGAGSLLGWYISRRSKLRALAAGAGPTSIVDGQPPLPAVEHAATEPADEMMRLRRALRDLDA
ncbi:MAG: cytochrome c-type biogenesis protein CcmH [Gemmatimonadales bacterium]